MRINICHTCEIEFTKPNNPNRVYKYCSVKCSAKNEDRISICSKKMKGKVAWNKDIKGIQPWMNINGLNNKGGDPWNKGKKGVQSAWNKGKVNAIFLGQNNPNWKGGVTSENDKIRKSIEYKQWREAVYKRDNYTCQECGEKERISGKLEADHIKPFAYFPELRFDVNNGRTLCNDCHKKTDTYLNKGRWLSGELKKQTV